MVTSACSKCICLLAECGKMSAAASSHAYRVNYLPSASANNLSCHTHRVKWRHRVYGHDTIAILWAEHEIMRRVKWRRFIALFKYIWISCFKKLSVWSLTCQQSVFKRCRSAKHFWEFLPTRWRQKSTGKDTEQNYVTDALCLSISWLIDWSIETYSIAAQCNELEEANSAPCRGHRLENWSCPVAA